MTKIDWSKAPKDATHFNPHSKGFMKIIDDDVYLWCEGATDHWMYTSGRFGGHDVRHKDGIPRPKEWTGKGLPPVDLDIEVRFRTDTNPEWDKAKLIYSGSRFIAIQYHDGEVSEVSTTSMPCEFRPIRTPEQIAAEERENELNRMVATVSMLDKGWARKVCAGLYDAGYRKFEIVENEE